MKRFIIGFMLIMIAGISNAQSLKTAGCVEDDSGSIDIAGTSAICGGNVSVPVRVQNAPGKAGSIGFEVSFDTSVLTYIGFEKKGALAENFDQFGVSKISSGAIRCGGFKSSGGIEAGTSGDLVYLNFAVASDCNESKLSIGEVKDDMKLWSASPGCFKPAGKCSEDINEDGETTPLDALCTFEKYMEICPTSCGIECADVCCDINSDSECTPADALYIFSKYLGNPVEGPSYINVTSGFPKPEVINIMGTGSQSSSMISFDVEDYNGVPVADGVPINFVIKDGPSGGELITLASDMTKDGKVSTTLKSGFASGPVYISAYYANDSDISKSSRIDIVAGQPVGEEFTIWAEHLNISGLWRFGLENFISVHASDYYGNDIPDNTAISFKTYNTGGIFDPGTGMTTNGFSGNKFISTKSPHPMQGYVSLTAEVNSDGQATHVTSLEVVPELESDPGYNQIIYAGTNGGGIYKSIDSGATWANISRSYEHQGQNWIQPYVNDIAADPDNPNRVYAATGYAGKGHIYRSLDGGIDWNSSNPEEWDGIMSVPVPVLTVLCDDDGYDKSNELTGNDKCFYNRGYFNENGRFVCEGDYRDADHQCEEFHDPNEVPCYRHVWFGTQGYGLYYSFDGDHFTRSGDLGMGIIVKDIVKVDGTHMKTARLYAATATGVYKSEDGGRSWSLASPKFTKHTNTLALYPWTGGHDIIYAGTEVSGVWVSTDSGQNWSQYNSGLDKGMNPAGSISGIENMGDIMDILVDAGNDLLYAITCIKGYPHPLGNVFVHELEHGSMAPGDWSEADLNLPQYQPPENTTLLAQYVLAPNIPNNPSALFIGGAGINFYKATKGLGIGKPDWQESKAGLTNLIMARTPVLFSGKCELMVRIVNVRRDDQDTGPQQINYPLKDGDVVTFHIYVQDINGNPPVEGSAIYVEKLHATSSGTKIVTEYTKRYKDVLTSTGTWRNLNDMLTNMPVEVSSTMQSGMILRIRYVPDCSDQVPGCSGSEKSVEFAIAGD